MIEMRWVRLGGERQLQYRYKLHNTDDSGRLVPVDAWSEWQRVPEVEHVQPGYGDGAQWISR